MSNKVKLNLDELKIQSFVTSLEDKENIQIKGGTGIEICASFIDACPTALCPPPTIGCVTFDC